MKILLSAILVSCSMVIIPPLFAANPEPPPAPTSQPADPAADRLTFLTLQLSSIEASLHAVNIALHSAGYKAVVTAEKADEAAKGNELMDRNGGAPIAWDKFYGKTAKQFEPRDIVGVPHPYQRPAQFDYLYHANNDQVAKANAEVAALGQKVDTLLARRRQLDAEQSALWATISWESLQNRDISLNPLYRFQLKAKTSTPATDARCDLLRPAILFLRTIDKTVADDLDSLSTNQDVTLTDVKNRTESAYAAAKEPLANAMLSADLDPNDLKNAKNLLASLKHLAELSKNVTEAYHLALDGDAANDDNRKLTFRAQLQFALLDYATATADLDYQLNKLAKAWELEGDRGIPNRDQPPASTTAITPAKPDNTSASITPTQQNIGATVSPPPTIIGPGDHAPLTASETLKSLADIFGANQLQQFNVDSDGTITAGQMIQLTLLGTEGKDFTISGEMYLDGEPYTSGPAAIMPMMQYCGKVDFRVRQSKVNNYYRLNGRFLGVAKTIEGQSKFWNVPVHLNQPLHQWLSFRFDVTSNNIHAVVGNTSGDLKGPLSTTGKNEVWIAPGAKTRNLRLEVADKN